MSIDGRGSGDRLPSSCCSNCMKTRFQISTKRSPSSSGLPGRAAGDRGAVVVEDLRAGAAGAGRAHHPEVVGGGDADDPVVGQAGDASPEVGGGVVVVVDGDEEPVLRQAEVAGQQLPGVGDGAFLEVVAEGEVAEHLEEGVMPGGIADVVEVVVLAAGAHALLAGGGAGVVAVLEAGEDVLELDHARVGEHQRRVVARHQRRGGNDAVVGPGEIVEEGGADVVQAGHRGPVRGRTAGPVRPQRLAAEPRGVHRGRLRRSRRPAGASSCPGWSSGMAGAWNRHGTRMAVSGAALPPSALPRAWGRRRPRAAPRGAALGRRLAVGRLCGLPPPERASPTTLFLPACWRGPVCSIGFHASMKS